MFQDNFISQEALFTVYLRDCFNAGYTLPQFCIDNDIKKPLIVGLDESQALFLWELHVQFQYDRRIFAEFALIKGKLEDFIFGLYQVTVKKLQSKNIDEINFDDYDKIFVLKARGEPNKNIIYMNDLVVRFIKRTYSEIPFFDFIQKNPGVKLIQINYPYLEKNGNNSDYEKKIFAHQAISLFSLPKIIQEAQTKGETISTPYDFLGYTSQDVAKLLQTPKHTLNVDGSVSMEDDKFLAIKKGRRIVKNQPEKFKNKIYFFGGCVAYGFGVPFDKTVESHLQRLLNEKNLPYRVENEATFNVNKVQDTFYNLNKSEIKFHSGDIIFFEKIFLQSDAIPFLDCSRFFDRPHKYGEVFPDPVHINELGHKALANYIFDVLVSNNFFRDTEFNYPPPQSLVTDMAYQKKILYLPKVFCKTKNSKNINRNYGKKDFMSARLS